MSDPFEAVFRAHFETGTKAARDLVERMLLSGNHPVTLVIATCSLIVSLKAMEKEGSLPKGLCSDMQGHFERISKEAGVL